ncbi:MAG: TetR/AcrR family transcriptional regulator [Anaerolineales bacterium]|nr:TetR/AcrR family transcriptional regulator [Anaerolineales bacterium]MCB8951667.1 TetR/AcrR family transcriptional regulator [Ardenticatenales bacterium]
MSLNSESMDPRARRTRRLLTQAFVELLEEKTPQAITVRDITQRANVNRATFYAHFADKYALYEYVFRDWFQAVLRARLPQPAPFNQETLHQLILAVFDFLAQLYKHTCRGGIYPPHQPRIETLVQQQVYETVFAWLAPVVRANGGTSPEVAATAISWAIIGVGLQFGRDASAEQAEHVATQALYQIAQGVPVLQFEARSSIKETWRQS